MRADGALLRVLRERTERDQPAVSEARGPARFANTLLRLICLKFTSYSRSKSADTSGVGRSRRRDSSGERCSGLPPGPKEDDE